ncbi:MAG TPA: DUF4013 domain-containing protein [Roseiflexaceae bacterium]|nr:DUF4013 domain-containing protein [Roseiflexaceae bacterium]
MDIGRAFSFVTKDESWVTKVLLGGLITLIPILGTLATYGYSYKLARNVARGQERPLPDWNEFGDILTRGLMGIVIQIVYTLPVILLYFIVIFATAGAAAATMDAEGEGGAGALIGLCLFPLLFLAAIACGLAALAAIARYLATDEFGEAFKFGEVFASLRNNIGPFVMLIVTAIAAGIVASLGIFACGIGVLFTAFYAQLVIGHALGQLIAQLYPARDIQAPLGYTPPPSY